MRTTSGGPTCYIWYNLQLVLAVITGEHSEFRECKEMNVLDDDHEMDAEGPPQLLVDADEAMMAARRRFREHRQSL